MTAVNYLILAIFAYYKLSYLGALRPLLLLSLPKTSFQVTVVRKKYRRDLKRAKLRHESAWQFVLRDFTIANLSKSFGASASAVSPLPSADRPFS